MSYRWEYISPQKARALVRWRVTWLRLLQMTAPVPSNDGKWWIEKVGTLYRRRPTK